MRRGATRWSFLFSAALVLAACGGGGSGSPAASDDGSGATTAATAPDATAAATEATGGGSGGAAGDFSGKMCDLVTLDEMNTVTAIAADEQEEQAFVQGSGYCVFTASGGAVPVGAISLIGGSTTDAKVAFDAYKADPASVAIPVSGAEAIWYPGVNSAFVFKGGYAGGIQVLAPKDGDFQTASSALAQGLADRMP